METTNLITPDKTFIEWILDAQIEIKQCAAIVQKRVPAGENLYALHLEELFEVSGPVARLLEEATQYHYARVSEILKSYPEGGNPKTKIDAAKKTPCDELRIFTKMQMLSDTITLKTSQAQSIIKAMIK